MTLPELNELKSSIAYYSEVELKELLLELLNSSTRLLEQLQPIVELGTDSLAIIGLLKTAIEYNNTVEDLFLWELAPDKDEIIEDNRQFG